MMDRKEKMDLEAAVNERLRPGVRAKVVAPEPDGKCELCGAADETRPYGPDGKEICPDCGVKNPEETVRRMHLALFGVELDPALVAEEAARFVRDAEAMP